jgi:hypothetical protein
VRRYPHEFLRLVGDDGAAIGSCSNAWSCIHKVDTSDWTTFALDRQWVERERGLRLSAEVARITVID